MGARTGYADGTFSWVDLATTEPEAATMFYGQLFGWTPEERRTADGRAYTVLCRDRQEVAGLYALPVADPAGRRRRRSGRPRPCIGRCHPRRATGSRRPRKDGGRARSARVRHPPLSARSILRRDLRERAWMPDLE